jgi:hypothetical protein
MKFRFTTQTLLILLRLDSSQWGQFFPKTTRYMVSSSLKTTKSHWIKNKTPSAKLINNQISSKLNKKRHKEKVKIIIKKVNQILTSSKVKTIWCKRWSLKDKVLSRNFSELLLTKCLKEPLQTSEWNHKTQLEMWR